MKILKLLAMLCVIATVSVSVTSCNKDDDDDDNGIVGTWRDTYDDEWDEITFKSNGTFTWTWHEDGYTDEVEEGTYKYEHPTLKLSIRDEEDGKVYTDTYTVISVSSSELKLSEEDDDEIYTYKKQ